VVAWGTVGNFSGDMEITAPGFHTRVRVSRSQEVNPVVPEMLVILNIWCDIVMSQCTIVCQRRYLCVNLKCGCGCFAAGQTGTDSERKSGGVGWRGKWVGLWSLFQDYLSEASTSSKWGR
jgi:hypothetical protein